MKTKYFVFERMDEEKQFKGYAICEPFLVKEMLVKRVSTGEILDVSEKNLIFSKKYTKELLGLNIKLDKDSSKLIEYALEEMRNKNNEKEPKNVSAFKEETFELIG